jgi:hypothetical protein
MKASLKKKQEQTQQQQQQQQQHEATITRNKWIAFTYFSPLVRKIANLFKQTKLKIAFRNQYNTTTTLWKTIPC